MRYTHNLKILHHRKHSLNISLALTFFLILLIIFFGFTKLDASEFFGGFGNSLFRVTMAYIISMFLSLFLAVVISINPLVEAVSLPILDVLQSFPSFALFPLLVVWFGRRPLVTIIILIITMIWPILFTLISAQKQIRTDIIEAAHAFGAKGIRYLVFVLFPLLFPAMATGSIVAWGEAWEAIIAAEIIVNIKGVGTYLGDLGANGNSQILVVGIILLLLLLFIINKYIWLPLLNKSTKYQQE